MRYSSPDFHIDLYRYCSSVGIVYNRIDGLESNRSCLIV